MTKLSLSTRLTLAIDALVREQTNQLISIDNVDSARRSLRAAFDELTQLYKEQPAMVVDETSQEDKGEVFEIPKKLLERMIAVLTVASTARMSSSIIRELKDILQCQD